MIATSQIQGTLMRLVDTMRGVMLSIGVCAALIAAMALVNTVLMSVFERTREFGLMRAMGAGVQHLLLIVCLETAFLSLLGALLGNLAIFVLRGTTEWLARTWLPFAPAGEIVRIGWQQQVTVVLITVVVGVLCGLYPALRASRLRPLQSLRQGG